MKKTFKSALALAFCIVTILATMIIAAAVGAPKAKIGAVTYNSVTVTWAKVKDADFYEVQRSTDGKKWTTLSSSVKGTSYKDSNKLTAGKSYKYRVRAVEDRLVLSDVYSSWSSAVAGKPVPEAVTGLKASSVNHNSAKLSWKKVSGASGYEVQVLNGSKWKSYKKVTTNSLTVSKLSLGKSYEYRVRAYTTVSKKAVYGAVSSTVKVTPLLKAPSNFVLKEVTSTSLKLSWSAVDGAKGYEVYNASTKKWINVKKATSYTVKKLKVGTKYSFEVRAYSGSYKGTKSATRTYITTPATPGKLKVTATTNSLTFSWGKVTGAAGYQPAYYDYATKKWTNLTTTTGTSVTISKLSAGTKYGVRVRAYVKNSNVKDISATASSAWTSKLDTYTVPAAPKSISLTGITSSSLSLSWPSVKGATSYEYYNPATKKWVSAGKNTTATVSKLAAGTKYDFQVRAKVSNRTSAASATYTFTTLCANPGNVKVSAATTNSLTFTWSKVTGAAGYQPAYYDAASKKWVNLSATTGNSATISKLTAGAKYAVRVRAYVKNSNVSGISGTTYTSWVTVDNVYTVPAAPSSISLTNLTTSSLTISWTKVNGATSYEYYNAATKKWVNTGKNTTATVSKLAAGTKYDFQVRAKVSNRTSAASATYTFTTLCAVPGNVKVSAATTNSLTFTWSKVTGAAGYQPAYYDAAAKKWVTLSATTGNSVTISKLSAGTSYTVRVRAYVKNSSNTAYTGWSAEVGTYTVPAAPSSISLTNLTTSSLTLSWAKVNGATSYEYYNPATKKWVSTGAANTATVSGLATGTSYKFQVRAKVSNRTSAASATYTFTTLCANPGNVKVSAATTNSLTFTWSKVTGAAGYQPAYYDAASKKWVNLSATTGNSATISKLTAGASYTVRVRAYVKNSSNTAYTGWSAEVGTYTVPAAPSSISLTNLTTSSLTLSWAKVNGATSYEYYNPATKKWVSTGAANTATVSSLSAGTVYSFKVRAKVSNRTSAESASYSFSTLCGKPSGLKASNISDSAITLSWSAVKGAEGYQIDYKKASDKSWTKLATTSGTTATASKLSSYTDYQFRVRAYVKNSNVSGISATGYGAYSSTVSSRTVISTPVLKAAATADNNITLTWTAITGATGYVVEKFDTLQKEWMVFDFEAEKWNYYEYLNDESVITTTENSFEDISKTTSRADVYRVTAKDTKYQHSAESAPVTGYTADLGIVIGDYDVTIELPANDGINHFQVYSRNPDNTTELLYEVSTSSLSKTADGKRYALKLNLAPDSFHSFLVIGKNTNENVSTKVTEWMTLRTKELKLVTSTSDSNYNASVNSQLLYLARAINNTKAYTGEITVRNNSEVSYSINTLKVTLGILPIINAKNPSDVEKQLAKFSDDGETISAQDSDKVDTTLTFKDGKCINEGNTNVKLKLFIEPTSNNNKTAYLYNSLTNQSAWKNGFESVSTTKNADGTCTINATLKKESTNTNYHSGFISSFSISDFSSDGFEMKSFNVGKSTISAVIDSEGYLKSYTANAPYDASMAASFSGSSDIGSMSMTMNGKTSFAYTITR